MEHFCSIPDGNPEDDTWPNSNAPEKRNSFNWPNNLIMEQHRDAVVNEI